MLNTELCNIKLENPTVLASGILGTSVDLMKRVAKNGAGAVTTKSIGPVERAGHKNPTVIALGDEGIINAVGLPTPGYLNMDYEFNRFKEVSVPVIASIYGSSVQEYVNIAKYLQKYYADIIELNISCPNKEDGMSFSSSKNLTKKLVAAVKEVSKVPIMPKLTPNCPDIVEIAKAAEQAGADAICAINTVGPEEIIIKEVKHPLLSYGTGGISGPMIKNISLTLVKRIAHKVKIPIVGTGGIMYGKDAIEMIKNGASAVGIGSGVYFREIDVFKKVCKEMKIIMKKEKIKSIKDIVGVNVR